MKNIDRRSCYNSLYPAHKSQNRHLHTAYSEILRHIYFANFASKTNSRNLICPKLSYFALFLMINFDNLQNLNMLKICEVMNSRNIKCANIT